MAQTISITIAAGGSLVFPHLSLSQNQQRIIPSIIYPDSNSPIGVLACDKEEILFVNPSGGEATAQFYIQVLGGGPYIMHWRGALASPSADSSFIELSGQQDVAGNVVPVDEIHHYYIQSDLGVVFIGPVATYGDDSNPGTKDLPFLTTQGAIQHAVRQGVQGALIELHYGGYSVRPPGGWPVSPAVDDPWDGYPTERRRYTQRDVRLTGTEAFQAAYSFLGPRKMFASSPILTYLGAVQVGQRVRLDFVEATGGMARGSYITLRRTDDDRDIFFPHVISESGVTGAGGAGTALYVEPPFSAAAWDAVFASQGGYFRGAVVAVEMAGDWEYEQSGVVIHGDGAGLIGGGRVGGGAYTINPTPHLAYMMIIRPHFVVVGEVYCATMWLDDGTVFVSGCKPRLAGCSGGPNGFVHFQASNGRILSDDSTGFPNLEVTGWAKVASVLPSPTADPVFQNGGPGELVVTGLVQVKFGDALATRSAAFRVLHGMTVIVSDGRIPIVLYGKDAQLFVSADVARPAYLVVHATGAVPCIWAIGGAQVFTNSTEMELVNGGGGTLRVGKGAAIAAGAGAGEFLEAAGFAGNFTRRLEATVTPGFPSDDTSAIIDATWMPTGYAGLT